MKRFTMTLMLLALLVAFSNLQASETKRNPKFWKAYSENLVRCLKEGNQGVQYAALQRIISYSDYLDVNDAVFEIMHIYRTDANIKAKQPALNALHAMKNKWAIGFLKLELQHEKNLALKKQIYAMIMDYEKS